ncbi:MAG: C40 family peptidase [Thermomicrobiales bacterium]
MTREIPRFARSHGPFVARIIVLLAAFGLALAATTPAFAQSEERNADGVAVQETQAIPPGQQIAGVAMAYLGYPYVWAGNTPAGFDCSGFTQYIVLTTLGIDIGHAVEGQPAAGAWIDYGAWLPGDLIFFQNTYRAGISHVGIYIGDGLFIHAENEGTGVVISSLYDGYYGPRYWGAVRVA